MTTQQITDKITYVFIPERQLIKKLYEGIEKDVEEVDYDFNETDFITYCASERIKYKEN